MQGRNSYAIDLVTKDLKYLTWMEAYKCLVDDSLPHALRANYAHLITSEWLFVVKFMALFLSRGNFM